VRISGASFGMLKPIFKKIHCADSREKGEIHKILRSNISAADRDFVAKFLVLTALGELYVNPKSADASYYGAPWGNFQKFLRN
jgi:hypothetical protein